MANLSVALLKPVSIFISECASEASAKNVAACIVALTGISISRQVSRF